MIRVFFVFLLSLLTSADAGESIYRFESIPGVCLKRHDLSCVPSGTSKDCYLACARVSSCAAIDFDESASQCCMASSPPARNPCDLGEQFEYAQKETIADEVVLLSTTITCGPGSVCQLCEGTATCIQSNGGGILSDCDCGTPSEDNPRRSRGPGARRPIPVPSTSEPTSESTSGTTSGSTSGSTDCQSSDFECTNGDCIQPSYECDGYSDCADGSDEDEHCESNTEGTTQETQSESDVEIQAHTCDSHEFECSNGDCIRGDYECDNIYDCRDGSDEDSHCNTNSECTDDHVWARQTSPGVYVTCATPTRILCILEGAQEACCACRR